MGVPRLACLRPAAWLKGGPSTAHLHQHKSKTLARGQASRDGRRGASSGTASLGWLTRRRRDQGGVPHEVPMTQAMTTKAGRAPGGRWPAQSPCFLFGAKGASAAVEYRGVRQRLPFRCNETRTRRTTRWRSPWSPRRRHPQNFAQAKTAFVRIACTSCPPSNQPAIVGSLPTRYLGRGPGPL